MWTLPFAAVLNEAAGRRSPLGFGIDLLRNPRSQTLCHLILHMQRGGADKDIDKKLKIHNLLEMLEKCTWNFAFSGGSRVKLKLHRDETFRLPVRPSPSNKLGTQTDALRNQLRRGAAYDKGVVRYLLASTELLYLVVFTIHWNTTVEMRKAL